MAFTNTQIMDGEFHGFIVQVPIGADMTTVVREALRTATLRFVTDTQRREVLFEKIRHVVYHVHGEINPERVTQLSVCRTCVCAC